MGECEGRVGMVTSAEDYGLSKEIFITVTEAKALIVEWRKNIISSGRVDLCITGHQHLALAGITP